MLSIEDIRAAADRIGAHVHRTPVRLSTTFSRMTGGLVHLKLENTQRTGSFKIRGALNKILMMSDAERRTGVVAASAGNHAQGVALAASLNNVAPTIVMPQHASIAKVIATRGYGAEVILDGSTYNDAFARCQKIQKETGATLLHAFDDEAVMAGQGTIGLEIMDALTDVDVVIVPVGGGGLIAGIATAVKAINSGVKVIGVQPEGSASLPASLAAGKVVPRDNVDTIADGLATKHVGQMTFDIIQRLVDDVVTVSDHEIARAILLLLERNKNVVEGAGAAAVAAVLSGAVDIKDKTACVLVSGGNIDINFLDQIIRRGLREEGRLIRVRAVVRDEPGQLRDFLGVIAKHQGNVRDVWHDRSRDALQYNRTEVSVDIETQGVSHQEELMKALRAAGYGTVA